jgi:adenylyltransferase/sulfurtransferase
VRVAEYDQWRREGRSHFLLDVRQPSEYQINRIDGATLIPLLELPSRTGDLPRDVPIVVCCKSGGRSAIAVGLLKLRGYQARNLSGGITAWDRLTKR